MRITKEIAEKNIGRYYDRYNRQSKHCGSYPRLIIRYPNGKLAYKRIKDEVCSPFDFDSDFNAEYADYFFDSLDECKE